MLEVDQEQLMSCVGAAVGILRGSREPEAQESSGRTSVVEVVTVGVCSKSSSWRPPYVKWWGVC